LPNKRYFSDVTTIIPFDRYSVGTRKRLMGLGILSYTDLAYYVAQLTSGERSYFVDK